MKPKDLTIRKQAGRDYMWGIRAGRKGEAHHLFIDEGVIALADACFGNLMSLRPDRGVFYSTYALANPEAGKEAICGVGGKFFRFAHEMEIGDLVIYPCFLDKRVYFGTIVGEYFYRREDRRFPHRRKVQWQSASPKAALSEGAIRELGAARTLFRFKSHLEEARQLMKKSIGKFRSL